MPLLNGDGLYTAAVKVRDLAGNEFVVTQTVRLDTTGPLITVTSPIPGATEDVGQSVAFTYTTFDVDNVVSSSATLDGATLINGSMIDQITQDPTFDPPL